MFETLPSSIRVTVHLIHGEPLVGDFITEAEIDSEVEKRMESDRFDSLADAQEDLLESLNQMMSIYEEIGRATSITITVLGMTHIVNPRNVSHIQIEVNKK